MHSLRSVSHTRYGKMRRHLPLACNGGEFTCSVWDPSREKPFAATQLLVSILQCESLLTLAFPTLEQASVHPCYQSLCLPQIWSHKFYLLGEDSLQGWSHR